MIQGFECQPRSHGTVTNHGDVVAILILKPGRHHHAESRTD